MTVNGETKKAVTDEQGRAEFKGLPAGANGRAEATVNGEQLHVRSVRRAGVGRPARHPRRGHRQGGGAEEAGRGASRGRAAGEGHGGARRQQPHHLRVSRRSACGCIYMLEIVNNARHAGGHRRAARSSICRAGAAARRRSKGRRRRRPSAAPHHRDRSVRVRRHARCRSASRCRSAAPTLTFEQKWPVAARAGDGRVAEARDAWRSRRRSSRPWATSRQTTARCSCWPAARRFRRAAR